MVISLTSVLSMIERTVNHDVNTFKNVTILLDLEGIDTYRGIAA